MLRSAIGFLLYFCFATTLALPSDAHHTQKHKNQIALSSEPIIKQQEKVEDHVSKDLFLIRLYKPTYVLPAYYTESPYHDIYNGQTPDNQRVMPMEFKGQFSIRFPLLRHILQTETSLNLAYTQLVYWQFYARSQYFRETDYEPELFLSTQLATNWFANLGITHQSNGRGGPYERSWNRAYINLILSSSHWMISFKPWLLIFAGESSDLHNPDIHRYLGHGRLLVAYKQGRSEISLMTRNNIESGFRRGALQLGLSFHVFGHLLLYIQGFTGYGQSLIEYNHYTNAVGIGIALNDWI